MLTAQAPAPRMDGLAVPSHGLKLLSGTANRPLAEEIARNLGVDLCRVNLGRFADGEISVRIDETCAATTSSSSSRRIRRPRT